GGHLHLALPFPPRPRVERRLQPLARGVIVGILPEDAGEGLGGLFDAALLESEGAKGDRRERVVRQHALEPARLARRRRRCTQQPEQRARRAGSSACWRTTRSRRSPLAPSLSS